MSKINLSGSHDAMLRQLDALKEWATEPAFTDTMIAGKMPTCPICYGGGGDATAFFSKREIHDHIYKGECKSTGFVFEHYL